MASQKYNYSYGGRQPTRSRRNRRGIGLYLIVAIIIVISGITLLMWAGSTSSIDEQEQPKTDQTNDQQETKDASKPIDSDGKRVITPTSADTSVVELCNSAEQAFAGENYTEASKLAYQVITSGITEGDALWEKAAHILGNANTKIFTSDMPFPQKKLHTVQKGDALSKIAKTYKTTVEAIQRANNMSPHSYNIRIGQTLSLYKGDWSIDISKRKRRLYLYDGGKLFKIYDIGIGKQNRTPTGTFKIVDKIVEPDWYSPQGKISFGSKENVLGTRWMKLKPEKGTNANLSGYGIHGTWKPESIGKAESNGCIRMKNSDVEELFAIVPRRIEVTIEE